MGETVDATAGIFIRTDGPNGCSWPLPLSSLLSQGWAAVPGRDASWPAPSRYANECKMCATLGHGQKDSGCERERGTCGARARRQPACQPATMSARCAPARAKNRGGGKCRLSVGFPRVFRGCHIIKWQITGSQSVTCTAPHQPNVKIEHSLHTVAHQA